MLLDKVKHILCISLILLVGVTTLYACKSDDKELQGEPVLQVQKSIGFRKRWGSSRTMSIATGVECIGN